MRTGTQYELASVQLLRQSDLSGSATQHLNLGATLLAKLEPDTPPLPPTALPAPGGLQASLSPASGTFTASWTAVTGAVRYACSASNGLSTSAQSVTATSASVTDPDGGAWAIQVRACRDATEASCGASAALTVGVTPKPVASVNVPAGTQSGAFSVTWPAEHRRDPVPRRRVSRQRLDAAGPAHADEPRDHPDGFRDLPLSHHGRECLR